MRTLILVFKMLTACMNRGYENKLTVDHPGCVALFELYSTAEKLPCRWVCHGHVLDLVKLGRVHGEHLFAVGDVWILRKGRWWVGELMFSIHATSVEKVVRYCGVMTPLHGWRHGLLSVPRDGPINTCSCWIYVWSNCVTSSGRYPQVNCAILLQEWVTPVPTSETLQPQGGQGTQDGQGQSSLSLCTPSAVSATVSSSLEYWKELFQNICYISTSISLFMGPFVWNIYTEIMSSYLQKLFLGATSSMTCLLLSLSFQGFQNSLPLL